MPAPTITPLPTPPSRSQSPETFSTDADAFLGALPDFGSDANAQAAYLDALAIAVDTDATTASNAAAVAAGAANYMGDYSAGTTYQIGESVSYNGRRYVAKTVNTGVTPADGANWFLINDGDVLGPVSATANGIALYDGTTGKLLKSGLNNGTAGQALISGGSGNAPSWQSIAAGNTSLTASGSITAGTAVVMSSANTAKAVQNFDAAFGSQNIYLSANGSTSRVFFNDNTVFVVYKNNSGNGLYARAGTISGATITWGTEFNCSMTVGSQALAAQYIGNNQYVVCCSNFSNTLQLRILTISGTTITGGSINTTVTNANYAATPALCVNTTLSYIVVMVVRPDYTLDGKWYAWSGTTISYQGNTHLNISADQIAGITQTGVTQSNRYVFATRRSGSQFDVYALYISSGILYWSGSSTTIATGTSGIWVGLGYNPIANRVFAFYAFNGSSGPRTISVREITGSSTTATVGAATTLNTFSQDLSTWSFGVSYSSYLDRFILAYEYGSSPLGVRFANATLVGTTWTFNEFITGSTNQRYSYAGVGFDMIPNTPYFLTTSNDSSASNAEFVARITQPFTDVDKWVGIAETSVSDGQTFNATVSGGLNTAVSGLTVGTRYYLSNTGTLTTTVGSYPVGIAKSATSLIVDRG